MNIFEYLFADLDNRLVHEGDDEFSQGSIIYNLAYARIVSSFPWGAMNCLFCFVNDFIEVAIAGLSSGQTFSKIYQRIVDFQQL